MTLPGSSWRFRGPRGPLCACPSPRATSARYGWPGAARSQPRNLGGTPSVTRTSPVAYGRNPRAQSTGEEISQIVRSAIQITMVWTSNKWRRKPKCCGSPCASRTSIITLYFLPSFIWPPKCKLPGGTPGKPRATWCQICILNLAGPPPRFADVHSIYISVWNKIEEEEYTNVRAKYLA